MSYKISVVIRNKNQSDSLAFLLKNLKERYFDDIDEVIVIDNKSTDSSLDVISKYKAKLVTIKNFSYGGSANLAAESSSNNIVVLSSAHAYPVSYDFFLQIKLKFQQNSNLAGVRCLHNSNDYKNYINNISSKVDPNKSGLIFCGSAFNKKVWEKHNFKADVQTFEDKEWSKRVLGLGYEIDFSPSIFAYDIKRTSKQKFFRFKNEVIGGYQLWHTDFKKTVLLKFFMFSILSIIKRSIVDLFYTFKRFFFMIKFIFNKPERF
jgi:glycosyltransferase involved in cell wall biosynthesis